MVAVGVAVPSAQAAASCSFLGSGTVSPPVKTQAEFHTYQYSGNLKCGTQPPKWITATGSGSFGCFAPGTSTSTIKQGSTTLGTVTWRHTSVSMTSTAATGQMNKAQMLFYVTNPIEGGKCASSGLGGAKLAGAYLLK